MNPAVRLGKPTRKLVLHIRFQASNGIYSNPFLKQKQLWKFDQSHVLDISSKPTGKREMHDAPKQSYVRPLRTEARTAQTTTQQPAGRDVMQANGRLSSNPLALQPGI